MSESKPRFHLKVGREVLGPVLLHLAVIVLVTGCQSEDTANTVLESPAPALTVEKTDSEKRKNELASATAQTEPHQPSVASATATADPLAFSREMEQAEKAAGPYQIIGQHTRNFMDLYNFFEAAGWNQAIDSMTMKSCPDGYEVFCQTRGVFVKLFQDAGGDVEALTQLVQQTDFRIYLYQLAAAADMYQNQYQNLPPQVGVTPAPLDLNGTAPGQVIK